MKVISSNLSRISKLAINIFDGVSVELLPEQVKAKGSFGSGVFKLPAGLEVLKVEQTLQFAPNNIDRALLGTYRVLLANLIQGVHTGFKKTLLLQGVGYGAKLLSNNIELKVGCSHLISHSVSSGIKVTIPQPTEIVIEGVYKDQVGAEAAKIRAYREPENYKGKGIRYSDEVVLIKEVKKKK